MAEVDPDTQIAPGSIRPLGHPTSNPGSAQPRRVMVIGSRLASSKGFMGLLEQRLRDHERRIDDADNSRGSIDPRDDREFPS